MNAAFFHGPNDIKLEKLDIKKEPNGQFKLLKVLSCSVCSYDVRTFRTGSFKVKPPVILGHEICAEVVNNYEGPKYSIKSGTRVTIYPIIPCLNCWYCNSNNFNLCMSLREIGSTLNGGFAEYILIPSKVFEIGGIVPVPDSVSNEEASLIEPLACCINGINQIKPMNFDSIIIIGDGPIGLMQLMLLKRFSPQIDVTVIGKITHRLETAKRLGANRVITFQEHDQLDSYKKLREIDGSISPNLIFVSNNNPSSLTLAFYLANKNGKVIIFSGIKNIKEHSFGKPFNIDPNLIHYSQISVYGSFSSNPDNLKEAMKLVYEGEINLKNLITDTFSLDSIGDALKTAESFKGLKSVINRFDF
jgi:L-iditol 2-dehydrogenase